MRQPAYIVWGIALLLAVLIVGLVSYKEYALYHSSQQTPVNRAATEGEKFFVTDIRLGWCNYDGGVIEHNYLSSASTVTLYLENFDGWLFNTVRREPRLLPPNLKPESLARRDELSKRGDSLTDAEKQEFNALRTGISAWLDQKRGDLRLMIAGHVFASTPPFDATALSVFGSREFDGDTFNRVVFRVGSPVDSVEVKQWRDVVRAMGSVCDAQITVALIVEGSDHVVPMPTLINADAMKNFKPVQRSLPLVPAIRRGAAAIAVLFTLAAILAAAVGTRALRDGRDPVLAATNYVPPWSLSRVVFAWWVAICVGSFAYLWAITGEHRDTLSGTAPLLLGIQGTTLLVTAGFGRRPLQRAPGDVTPPSAAEIAAKASRGFFADLLSEGGEPEVTRLQMIVWNLVLGVVFIWQTVFEWKMPDFDANIMTLLGISSTAYASFKFLPGSGAPRPQDPNAPPEKVASKPPVDPAPAAPTT